MLLAGIACATLFTACKDKPKPLNVVQVRLFSNPPDLHPVNGLSVSMVYLYDYLHRRPTQLDLRSGEQIPMLVKELGKPSADKLSYSYELRNDVKWDDGSPLTVDDIIFTMKVSKCQLVENGDRKIDFIRVSDIVKDPANPLKFTVNFNKIYYQNQNVFDFMFVVEKKAWDPQGLMDKVSIPNLNDSAFKAATVPGLAEWAKGFNSGESGHDLKKIQGLGPYAVSEWNTNYIVLTRKAHWWGENDTSAYCKANPDKMVFSFVSDDNTEKTMLINGKLDVDNMMSTATYNALAKDTSFTNKFNMSMVDQFLVNVVVMNLRPEGRTPFFTDKKVRRAMALLTPVDEINRDLAMSNGTRQASFIQPISPKYYNSDLKLLPFDVEQAKKLLDEAGWKDTDGDNIRDKVIDGKKVKFSIEVLFAPKQKTNEGTVKIMQQNFSKAGVEIKLVPDNSVNNPAEIHKKGFDMIVYGLSGEKDLDDPYELFSQESWAKKGNNVSGFGSKETDELIKQIQESLDESQRIKLVKQLEAIVYDEQPYIYLYSVKKKTVISKRFENGRAYPFRPGLMLNTLKLK